VRFQNTDHLFDSITDRFVRAHQALVRVAENGALGLKSEEESATADEGLVVAVELRRRSLEQFGKELCLPADKFYEWTHGHHRTPRSFLAASKIGDVMLSMPTAAA